MIWQSMDDLPNIQPERRELFSALLAEILVPADSWPYIIIAPQPEKVR